METLVSRSGWIRTTDREAAAKLGWPIGLWMIYRTARAHGYAPPEALRISRTCQAFEQLESAGLARIRVEVDTDPDVSWMKRKDREEWNGEAYGTIAECRQTTADKWEHVDSCWGHIGYAHPDSPIENAYVVDEMRACLDWHRKHLTDPDALEARDIEE